MRGANAAAMPACCQVGMDGTGSTLGPVPAGLAA
jgi:hypothetical protein